MTNVTVNTGEVLEVTAKEIEKNGMLYVNNFIGAGYVTPMELEELMEVYTSNNISKVEVYFGGLHVNAFRLNGCTEKEVRLSQPGKERINVTKVAPVMGHVRVGNYVEVNRKPVTDRLPSINADHLVVTKCTHSSRRTAHTLSGSQHFPSPISTVIRVFIPQNRLHQQTR